MMRAIVIVLLFVIGSLSQENGSRGWRSVSLPPDLDARVDAAAVVLDSSRSRLCRVALVGYLAGLPADQRAAIDARGSASVAS